MRYGPRQHEIKCDDLLKPPEVFLVLRSRKGKRIVERNQMQKRRNARSRQRRRCNDLQYRPRHNRGLALWRMPRRAADGKAPRER